MADESSRMNIMCMLCVFSGTVDDTEMVEGLVFTQKVVTPTVTRVEKARIGLIQFQLSPPKTDVCNVVRILSIMMGGWIDDG